MSTAAVLETHFAPAARADSIEIQRQVGRLAHADLLMAISEAVPSAVLVLNAQRQIVYSSALMNRFVPEPRPDSLIPLRPGEAMACIHASQNAGGCGTTEFCIECGAVRAILAAQAGHAAVRECRIVQHTLEGEEALDLRVQATPFEYDGELYTLFAIADISHEKRREILERTFFHDLNNTAGIISNLVYILSHASDTAGDLPIPDLLAQAADRLCDEIKAQRQLLEAESNSLQLSYAEVDTSQTLAEMARLYGRHEVADRRFVRVAPDSERLTLVTDPTLLGRILGNMIKNGLEASLPDETVTIGCARSDTGIRFWVHNTAVMPRAVQHQLFQRSFSTKGVGRGLGTYSLKLLGERYLGGRVAFTSAEGQGTTFTLTLPERPTATELPGLSPVD